jgi:carboxymethylenebutenolidase
MPIHTEWTTFSGSKGNCRAYIASMEKVSEPQPTVIIIQEIWGVDAHIQDVAQRFAAAGYVAIAPDLFADNGVCPEELKQERLSESKDFLHSIPHTAWFNPQERETEIKKQPTEQQDRLRTTLESLFSLLSPAKSVKMVDILTDTAAFARNIYEKTNGMPVTSVGFCMGGMLSAILATRDSQHAGSIIFYGRPPQQGIADIQCPVIGFYGGQDPNITDLVPSLKEEMEQQGKSFEVVIYPNAKHAFFNDTNPTYDVKYSRDAFARSLSFLNHVTTK